MRFSLKSLPALALTSGLGIFAAGCVNDQSAGYDPPNNSIYFPSGITLDPRVDEEGGDACQTDSDCIDREQCGAGLCREPSQWLFVAGSNGNYRYNAGSLLGLDLDRLFSVATSDDVRLPGEELDPTSAKGACRQLKSAPQKIECTEEPFIEESATVHFGNFSSVLRGWHRPKTGKNKGRTLLMTPVRGDPSITFFELSGGDRSGKALHFECGQDGALRDSRHCSDEFLLQYERDDTSLERLNSEPTALELTTTPAGRPLAFVSHPGQADISLLSLDGLRAGDIDKPVLVDQSPVFFSAATPGSYAGAYGLAVRPCDPESAPLSTNGCEKPLVYGSFRHGRLLATFGPVTVDENDLPEGEQCVDPKKANSDGIICDERLVRQEIVNSGGVATVGGSLPPATLAGIGFTDGGDSLYVVQTTPGALIKLDTSLDAEGNPQAIPVKEVEVCSKPAKLLIYDDGQSEIGLVSCYQSASVYAVNLDDMSVMGTIRVGAGPHEMIADYAREKVYAANTLDATVSVIEMGGDNGEARLTETIRIGLRQHYE